MNHIASPDNSDPGIERQIQAKGLTAPRITPADLKANIVSEHYFTAAEAFYSGKEATHIAQGGDWQTLVVEIPKPLMCLTFCVLVLKNGFTVTGESACASPENFDAAIGKQIARANAEQKIWPLMGYALKEMLHMITQTRGRPASAPAPDEDFLASSKACDRFDPTCESCQ